MNLIMALIILSAILGAIFCLIYLNTSSRKAVIIGALFFLNGIGLSLYLGNFPVEQPLSEAEKWELFKTENNCKVVEKREGHSTGGVGVTTGGHVGVMFGDGTPSQTAYLCDDGVTYWKNEK